MQRAYWGHLYHSHLFRGDWGDRANVSSPSNLGREYKVVGVFSEMLRAVLKPTKKKAV